jgi:hypothetical protein
MYILHFTRPAIYSSAQLKTGDSTEVPDQGLGGGASKESSMFVGQAEFHTKIVFRTTYYRLSGATVQSLHTKQYSKHR